MSLLLILEDNPGDLRQAVDAGKRAGFAEFEIHDYASAAHIYLEKAMGGKVPLPDAMVVDLDLGIESGFELLRFWHSTPKLKSIPTVVWTVMGDHEREICRLFGITRCFSKRDDIHILEHALASILPGSGNAAAS